MKHFSTLIFLLLSMGGLTLSDGQTYYYGDYPNWQSNDSLFTISIAAEQMDNTSGMDIVAANYRYPYTFENITSANADDYDTDDLGSYLMVYWNGSQTPSLLFDSQLRKGHNKVLIYDLDGDGWNDIISGNVNIKGGDAKDCYYLNDGDQTFTKYDFEDAVGGGYTDPSQDTHDMALGDINNDGIMDVVSVGVRGKVLIYLTQRNTDQISFTTVEEVTFGLDEFFPDSGDVFGTVVECGDINDDGYFDLFVNFSGYPTVFINTQDAANGWFDEDIYVQASNRDRQNTASFGFCTYDSESYLGLAIGSMMHSDAGEGYCGSAIYVWADPENDTELTKVWLSAHRSGKDYQMVTDIKWADIDDNGTMDIIAGAYPNLYEYTSTNLKWENGFAQYYENPTMANPIDQAQEDDWSCGVSNLTTSIYLKDLDGGGCTMESLIIDSNTWAADSLHRLYYFDEFPVHSIVSVEVKESEQDSYSVPPDSILKYCYDLANGWISFDGQAQNFYEVKVEYQYSPELDLIVGNDGPNTIYYHSNLNGTYNQSEDPGEYTIASATTYPTGSPLTSSLMDEDGAIGITLMYTNEENTEEVLQKVPECKLLAYWYYWKHIEQIRGLFFWDNMDKALNKALNNGAGVNWDINDIILFMDGSAAQQWAWSPDNDLRIKSIIDERYNAYFARSLVNRYRPGGLLYDYDDVNNYNFTATRGVDNFMFENEPNLRAYYNSSSTRIEALEDKLKYNYNVIKLINSDYNLISPNFGNPRDSNNHSGIDETYITELYTDNILHEYTDIIAHQMHVLTGPLGGETQTDPVSNDSLEAFLDDIEDLMNLYDDDDKPFISIEWFYHWNDDITPLQERSWSATHNAEFFTMKHSMWSFAGLHYGYDGGPKSPPDEVLVAINQQAETLNGTKFYVETGFTNPVIISDDDFDVSDYIFERSGTPDTYVHQIRAIEDYNENIMRIPTVEDNTTTMENKQATIVSIIGNEWDREYGTDDPSEEYDVYVKFYDCELDTTPIWVDEVYDNSTSDVSIICNLPHGQWRLISFNINPQPNAISTVFNGVGQDLIWRYDGAEWNTYNPLFTTWDVEQGYLVHMPDNEDDSEVIVEESSLYGETTALTFTPDEQEDTLGLDYYRYYISYLPSISMPVDSAFFDLIDRDQITWIRNTEGLFYLPDYPNQSDYFLCHPGEGYDLNLVSGNTINNFVYNTTTFVPDSWNGGKEGESGQGCESLTSLHFDYRQFTQDVYPIVIDTLIAPCGEVEVSDEIAVFTSDGICCGARILEDDQTGFVLTAWQDDIATDEKDGFDIGETITFKYWDCSADTEYVIEEGFTIKSISAEPIVAAHSGPFGKGQYAVRSLFFSNPVNNLPSEFALYPNYPNPFNPVTCIRFDLPYQSKVRLDIFNVLGQKVATLIDGVVSAGYRSVNWDSRTNGGAEMASGMYIYRIHAESVNGEGKFDSLRKMVLIK